MRLIFATNNENKMKEIRGILGEKYKDFIFSLKDMNVNVDPEESGKDYIENANIKSKAVYEELKKQNKLKNGDYIISDDTGLSIDYLDGAPCIYSSRFMGKETKQSEKNEKIIALMKDVRGKDRNAHFTTVLSVIEHINDGNIPHIINFEGRMDGVIAEKIEGNAGFGYDPIFMVDGKTYSELGFEGKNAISHRAKALRKFIQHLENNL